MCLADDLVQVLQAHLVLDQNDQVEILLFQHLAVAAKTGVDLADLRDLLFFQIMQHHTEDAPQRSRILTGAVCLIRRQLQMLVDGPLLIIVQTGVHRLCHRQGVDIGRLQLDAAALCRRTQKPHVKGVDVVPYQNTPARKFQKRFERFGFAGRILHHFVGDAGQLSDLGGNGLAGFDKGIKLLHHLAVADDHAADLGQVFYTGVQTGRFGVEHAEFSGQQLILDAVDAGDHIIHKVRLAAIDQLEVRILLVDIVRRKHCFRVALTDTVIGDRDRRVPHPVRQTHDAARITEAVHAGKLGMQVQLHPLFRSIVLPLFALHKEHIIRVHDIVMLILVIRAVAAHDDGRALADGLPLGAVLTVLRTDLQVDGAGVVGDGNGIDLAVVALDLGKEHVAPDHALAALAAQLLERCEIFGGEHFAVEDGHRLVGQIQPVHLDGRCGILLFKLDHRRRDLTLQLFFQLMLFRFAHRAGQGDFGLCAGVCRNTLCQQALKLHLLQELGAVAYTDCNILPHDGDRAPIQKAVDGHTIPLHVLQQLPQCCFVQHGVPEQVFDLQFKALIVRLQRCQKPRTQPLIQRGSALQGKYDLPLLPQHAGVLHDHLAEAGCKIRIRHKLRPKLGYKWFHRWILLFRWVQNSTNCRTRFSGAAVIETQIL